MTHLKLSLSDLRDGVFHPNPKVVLTVCNCIGNLLFVLKFSVWLKTSIPALSKSIIMKMTQINVN